MSATIPALLAAVACHAEIRLVNERGRLQGLMRLPLARETRPREFAQFVIDFGQQVARRAGTVLPVEVRRHQTREL
jgi:hypothetical protein